MTKPPARQTRYQQLSATARSLLVQGESAGCEFKQNADAVKPGVLAALANWVALEDNREVAHLLVGVEEIEDAATGVVTGKSLGLPKGVDRSVARLQEMAKLTRPIPIDAFIVEEGVATATPFIRIEVRPTMPPHFDDEGRRQIRQGRSTRALTDEELLQIYLAREGRSFAARFQEASRALHEAVGGIGSQVESIADAIETSIAQPLAELTETAGYAASAASAAEDAANTVSFDVTEVERLVRELQGLVEELQDESVSSLAAELLRKRQFVWLDFAIDTYQRDSARAERLAERLRGVLSADLAIDDARNAWEIQVWDSLLRDRQAQPGEKGTLSWWEAAVEQVIEFSESPAYQMPEFPDLRAELRSNIDKALDDPTSLTRQFADPLKNGR